MKHLPLLLTSAAALLFAAGCGNKDHDDHDHDHDDHDHPHGDHDHGDHDHDDDHGHSHKKKDAGPNGGRILTALTPHLEFLVREDRKVQLAALQDLKAVPIGTQTATLTGGDRGDPTTLNFAKEGDVLVSDKPLPEGKNFPVILQVAATAGADLATEKFQLNLADCPTCDYKEYACICNHDHGGHGHDHGHKHD